MALLLGHIMKCSMEGRGERGGALGVVRVFSMKEGEHTAGMWFDSGSSGWVWYRRGRAED